MLRDQELVPDYLLGGGAYRGVMWPEQPTRQLTNYDELVEWQQEHDFVQKKLHTDRALGDVTKLLGMFTHLAKDIVRRMHNEVPLMRQVLQVRPQ